MGLRTALHAVKDTAKGRLGNLHPAFSCRFVIISLFAGDFLHDAKYMCERLAIQSFCLNHELSHMLRILVALVKKLLRCNAQIRLRMLSDRSYGRNCIHGELCQREKSVGYQPRSKVDYV